MPWTIPNLVLHDKPVRLSTDLCRETSIILKMFAPLVAAEVRNPDRSEWPENAVASRPTAPTIALTIFATDLSDSPASATPPDLLTARNTGPLLIPAASSHSCRALTGHTTAPRAI